MTQAKILFVCTGNICRSPTAEGVARAIAKRRGLAERFLIASAGTHSYHVGDPPDARSTQFAAKRGYDLSRQRARRLEIADFYEFDYLLAMDQGHLRLMNAQRPADATARVALFTSLSKLYANQSVPDPYYGGDNGFEEVLDMIEEATERLFDEIVAGRGPEQFQLE
jgi:protein-tyrosine phosphatase